MDMGMKYYYPNWKQRETTMNSLPLVPTAALKKLPNLRPSTAEVHGKAN